MEAKQDNICGYCGNKLSEDKNGILTLLDKEGKLVDKINVCNGCLKRLHVKIALSGMSKEDVDSLDEFLSRSKK
ncbi:MAG: hypothetical protein IKY09_02625 [Methanocorpusculum sp.]|nr:hypothetical protein [Methanocorpusculum sp.]MBR5451031.1 hypothetical protein [Methanocorpusculum sp.]